jgi:hypothetical protein
MIEEDVIKTQEATFAEALKAKRVMTALTASEGWRTLMDIVERQVTQRTNRVMLIPLGEDGRTQFVNEFEKGEASGMRTVMALPGKIISVSDDTIKGMRNAAGDTDTDIDSRPSDDDAGIEFTGF